ncbi:transmembrane protein [Alcanivorax marinus]|nr:transmembrane protein [Alloalcanivorax marinus]
MALLVFMAGIMGISLLGLFVPVLGNFAPTLIGPVLVAGLHQLAWRRWHDEEFDFGQLFVGFSQRTGPLFLTGLTQVGLQVLFTLLMVVAVLLLFGPEIAALFTAGFQGEPLDPTSAAAFGQMGMIKVALLTLIMVAISIPYMAMIWFQVPLVFFGDRRPLAALGESLTAVLRNWLPMLWYGLVPMLFLLLLAALLGVLLAGANMLFGADSLAMLLVGLFSGFLSLVFALFLLALTTVSVYASFRDIFGVGDDEPDATPDL